MAFRQIKACPRFGQPKEFHPLPAHIPKFSLASGRKCPLPPGREEAGFCLGFKGSTWSILSQSLCWQFLKPILRKVFEFFQTKHTCLGYFPWFHYRCLVPLFSWPAPRCHFDLTSSREVWTLKIWKTSHPCITCLFPCEWAHVSLSGVMCK